MPLSRYQIKNEYGLADPELYRAADKDDPEAILEGVAMAGLVGLLRQLGDLAEFAAEIFHDLHEEVMATAARGHGLLVRVQQLETDLPSIERTLLSQTSHSYLLYNSGSDWHPNLRMEQNLITQGDFPRFIMDSYEECRGPPKLFLLDKFDVAGAGACLKRYTDPSFFNVDGLENSENHWENKPRKAKKKGSQRMNGGTPQAMPKGQTRLHDLLQEERVESHLNVPASHVKLKRRLSEFPCNLKTGGSYMEKFLKINSKELDLVSETSAPLVPCNGGSSSTVEEFDVNTVSREEVSHKRSSSSEIYVTLPKPSIDQLSMEANYELSGITRDSSSELYHIFSPHQQADEKEIEVDGERKMKGSAANSYQSDEIVSDADNYMDALATIDSDIESDIEYKNNSYKYLHSVEDSRKQQESMSDLPDSEPVGSFNSLTDNENLSSSGELSELSSDGTESSDYGIVEEQTLDDLESMYNDIGEEQQQTSSSRRTYSYPVTLSFDLEGSLEGDASEHSESNEACYTNNELFFPSDAAQNFLHASSSENHLDDQDQDVTSPILIKTVQSENNNYAYFTENSTDGDNAGDVPPSKDLMNTVTEEPNIDVKDSFESHMNQFHFSFMHIDEKSEPFVAQGGEKQLEFSVLYEEEQPGLVVPQSEEEKPQMLVSHAEDLHQFTHSEEESQSVLSYTKEDQNQLAVSNKEEQTQLLVADIEMQRNPFETQAEEQSQLTLSQEEHPQLSPSQAEEEQLQLITLSTEEPSPESLDTVSPVNLRLADDGENVSISSELFMDRRDFVQDKFQSDALNLEYSPLVLCDEATNTEQSKAMTAVSIACDRDDVCLPTISVEESHPVVQSFPSSYFLVKPEEIRVPSISTFPRFSLPGPSHNTFDEMPPLPPLPPVQWRTPKFQHAPSPLDIDPPMMSSLDHETKIPHPISTFFAMKDDISHHEFNLSSVSIKDYPFSEEAPLNPWPMVNEEDNGLQEKPIEPLDGSAPETSSGNEKSSLSVTTMEQTSTNMNDEKPLQSVSHSSSILAPETSSENEMSSLSVTTMEQTSTNMNDEKPPQSISYSSSILTQETSSENEKSSLSVTTMEQTSTNMNDEKPPQSVYYSSSILAPEMSSENEKSSLSVTTMEQTSTNMNDEKPSESVSYSSSILAPVTSSENEKSSVSVTTVEQTLTDMNEEKPPQSVSYSTSMFAHPLPEVADERLNGGLSKKLPRPRNPLIDAVVALDKTKLRKVTDRIRPPIGQNVDERNSFLEEIRTKSFNLRPTAVARPSIQGPNKTNLRVAAILAKANSIRQAHAGSDDDDDDSWSD